MIGYLFTLPDGAKGAMQGYTGVAMLPKGEKNFPTNPFAPRALGVLASLLLLGACSTFSPTPVYEPPYYIDEYGMVYAPEGGAAQGGYRLRPRFGSFSVGLGSRQGYVDPFYDPFYNPLYDPFGRNLAFRHPFYARSPYRPPIYRGVPGAGTDPVTAPPVTAPVTGSAPIPVRPVSSPVIPRQLVRLGPEPRFDPRDADAARRVWQRPAQRRSGAYGSHRGEPRTGSTAPRTARPRVAAPRRTPRPPPPSRPREIDP